MNLSAKTTLLAFWVFCKICVTFAPRYRVTFPNNRLAGYNVLDHHPRYNPMPGFRELNLGEPVNNDRRNENEGNDEFHEHPSGVDPYAEEENEIVSVEVKECKDAIHTFFPSSDPYDNLVDGFCKLTEGSFYETDKYYEFTHGYYVDLVERATDLESATIFEVAEIWSPIVFCEKTYERKIEECTTNIEELGIKPHTEGLEAYRMMYLTMDFQKLNIDYLFPDRTYQSIYMTYASNSYGTILQMNAEYFIYLWNRYNYDGCLNLENLRTPLQYCKDFFSQ